jgi:hypothetical protein
MRRAAGLPVTQVLIADHLGVDSGTLDNYPPVRAVYDDLVRQRALDSEFREEKLLAQVEAVISILGEAGRSVDQKSVAAHVGM